MFLVLGALFWLLLLAALVVGAILSMGLGLGLATHPRTRWITPMFTIIVPFSLLGAFLGAFYIPALSDLALIDLALQLALGTGFGLIAGLLLASISWWLAWRWRSNSPPPPADVPAQN